VKCPEERGKYLFISRLGKKKATSFAIVILRGKGIFFCEKRSGKGEISHNNTGDHGP